MLRPVFTHAPTLIGIGGQGNQDWMEEKQERPLETV
jgi:hypothetical protein